jgi:hypothetical protein
MLRSVRRDTRRGEAQYDQGAGENLENVRIGTDVDNGIDVVGRARWSVAMLCAMQVDHLAADESPPVVEPLVEIHDAMP